MNKVQRIIAEMFGIDEIIEDLEYKRQLLVDEKRDLVKQVEFYKDTIKSNEEVNKQKVAWLNERIDDGTATIKNWEKIAEERRKQVIKFKNHYSFAQSENKKLMELAENFKKQLKESVKDYEAMCGNLTKEKDELLNKCSRLDKRLALMLQADAERKAKNAAKQRARRARKKDNEGK